MPRESPAIKINKIKVSEKMKRLLSAIIAAALMLTMLAACSSNSGSNLTSDNLAKIINENGNEMTGSNPAIALDSEDENLSNLFEWNEWDKANFETGAFSFSLMNVQAYTIAATTALPPVPNMMPTARRMRCLNISAIIRRCRRAISICILRISTRSQNLP